MEMGLKTGGWALFVACCVFLAACGATEATPTDSDGSPTAIATPSADSSALEGSWRSGEVTEADLYRAGASVGLSRAETRAESPDGWEFPIVFTIRIRDGRWLETETYPGGVPVFGWEGTYEIVDDRTVVATDPCGPITYRYEISGDILTIDMVEDGCKGEGGDSAVGELLAQTLIYESSGFTREA